MHPLGGDDRIGNESAGDRTSEDYGPTVSFPRSRAAEHVGGEHSNFVTKSPRGYGRIPIISIGGSTSEGVPSVGALEGAAAGASDGAARAAAEQPDTADMYLRVQLRIAAGLRGSTDPADREKMKRIFAEVIEKELPSLREQVKLRGFRQTGQPWVDECDVEDVLQRACIRALDLFEKFEGATPQQFRAALRRCVEWSVADHVRKDQADKSVPVDPLAGPAGLDGDAGPSVLDSVPAPGVVEDRAEFLERLAGVTELEPRAADVVMMRSSGMSSKETAAVLGLSPANVDQIFSRSIKKMRELSEGERQ